MNSLGAVSSSVRIRRHPDAGPLGGPRSIDLRLQQFVKYVTPQSQSPLSERMEYCFSRSRGGSTPPTMSALRPLVLQMIMRSTEYSPREARAFFPVATYRSITSLAEGARLPPPDIRASATGFMVNSVNGPCVSFNRNGNRQLGGASFSSQRRLQPALRSEYIFLCPF